MKFKRNKSRVKIHVRVHNFRAVYNHIIKIDNIKDKRHGKISYFISNKGPAPLQILVHASINNLNPNYTIGEPIIIEPGISKGFMINEMYLNLVLTGKSTINKKESRGTIITKYVIYKRK